jgi:hypothetical protein
MNKYFPLCLAFLIAIFGFTQTKLIQAANSSEKFAQLFYTNAMPLIFLKLLNIWTRRKVKKKVIK